MEGREIARRIELLSGVGLVVFGGLFALAELAGGRSWGLIWPLFVIVPGVLLFVGAFSFGRGGGFLAIPGAVVTVSGLLLLLTNTLDAWTAWAYLWALVVPGSVGLGLLVFGARTGSPAVRSTGIWLGIAGLALFGFFGAFLELVVGVSGPFGPALGRVLWPTLLIVAGLVLIVAWSRRT
ncbi:MAG TPA: hypothetical protein VGK50_01100 [Coriobacteriia bacterium]|jgi:hypothetical protein